MCFLRSSRRSTNKIYTVATSILALTPDPAGAKNLGNGAGGQFIGGACNSNKDCASACCAAQTDGTQPVCSGPGAQFQVGKLGCGSAEKGAAAGGAGGAGGAAQNGKTGNNGNGKGCKNKRRRSAKMAL